MKQPEYESNSFEGMFRNVLQEFFGDKPTRKVQGQIYDVTDDDYDSGAIVPPFVTGDETIAVKIVSDAPTVVVNKGSVAWTSSTARVTADPQLIVGRDPRRRTVIIKNISENAIAIDSHVNVKLVDTPFGFSSAVLPAGDAISLDTQAEVYAISSVESFVSVYQIVDAGQ